MAHEMQVLLFGDQSEDIVGELKHLVSLKSNALLSSFFERACNTLREEIAQSPEAHSIPAFTSIPTLLSRYVEAGGKDAAIESALVSIYHTASLLRHVGDGVNAYPKPESTRIVGSCTGLLSAATVSCATTYLQLVSVSIEVLRVAFRVGSQVSRLGDALKQESTGSARWSAIFPGVDEKGALKALEDFYSTKDVPSTSRPYVSAKSSNAVTISGHPRELDALIDAGALKSNPPIRFPIYGPYHAPHLYNDEIVPSLVSTIPESTSASWIPKIPIIANGGEQAYNASTFNELMEEVINDILLKPLDWDSVTKSCVSSVNAAEPEQCRIVPVGGSNAANSLMKSFTSQKPAYKVRLDDKLVNNSQPSPPTGRRGKSKIAICGMSGRFPDAEGLSEFWDLLQKGLDVHRKIPSDRFDADAHCDPTGKRKNTTHTPYGCFVEHPGLFDAKFFNMSPKEAKQTDPMHRLALVTAYEAMEMAGFVPNRTPSSAVDRVGTFYGQTSDDWREIQNGQNVQTHFIPGGVRPFAPGRINYHFGFSGPSFSVDTACSSSLAAINIACNSLWEGECDTALAGGLNILTNPDIFAGLSRGSFLSKTGNCKTFDDDADGYCRGDGVASVMLKRLEDAEADGDPILAVVLGTETNHSAEATSITHPHAGAQEFLFKKVLTESGVHPNDISYVEMHGTGTQAGDAIEMESVLNSFAPAPRPKDSPLHIGSVKANVGHGEAASGITSLVKCLLMLENQVIPPHAGIKDKINHNFPDLDALNVHISRGRETPWVRPDGGKRNLFLNNFSAAGGNTSLLMEDAPLRITDGKTDPRSNAVVPVSGKTKPAFVQNAKKLIEYMEKNPSVDLPSLSYTTTARRNHYNFRTIVSGSDLSEIKAGLEKALNTDSPPISSTEPPAVFAFTGQGCHYNAMGKQLYETIPEFRSDIQCFDLLAQSQGFSSIIPLVDGSVSIESLSPVVVQTGAVCIQIALARLWALLGVKPMAVVGHSLGEYAALHIAGVLSINDTIFLTATRAKILVEQCSMNSHAMLSVAASSKDLADVIDGVTYELACVNGPKATVISGQNDKIDKLKEDLSGKGFKCTKLNVPFAFHSSQVDPALDLFETASVDIQYNTPKLPVISPLLCSVIEDQGTINAEYLRRHFRSTVNFLGGLEAAKEAKVIEDNTVFLEVGSHPVCTGMVKSSLGSSAVAVPSLRNDEDAWKTLASSLCVLYKQGVVIDWNFYHGNFPECQKTLRLPSYGWEAVNYWIDYVNNWTLTKGDDPSGGTSLQQEASFSTSTVQRLVEDKLKGESGTMITETDISHPDLEETINGHIVNGSALCSSAVYADMAMTVGGYAHRKLVPTDEDFVMNVTNMVVEKPLIATGETQLLRTHSTVDLAQGTCDIILYSVNQKGEKTVEHAHCQVQYGNDATDLSLKWSKQKYLIQSQVDRLVQGGQKGELSRLPRKMAYKLFSTLVDYQDAYKGMAEVILDSPNREGTALVELKLSDTGKFSMEPYHIDSICHLAGFIMNANDEIDPDETVYVNHGWESLEFSEKPNPGQFYRSYVRMQPKGPDSKDYSGDVYVFNEDNEIIGRVGGLEFQYLGRKTLDRVLPKPGGTKSSAPAKASAPSKSAGTSSPKKASAKPAQPAPEPVPIPATNNVTRSLDVMADEIGVPTSELRDDSELDGFGVDSLMSLTISGRLGEELDMEVPSTDIADCQTIKEVKTLFARVSGTTTPADSNLQSEKSSGSSTPLSTGTASSATSISDVEQLASEDEDKIGIVREAIAEETGLEPSELTSSVDLATVGVDSLMALQILGFLREEKDIDLSPSFFVDNETFGDVEKALGGGREKQPAPEPVSEKPKDPPSEAAKTDSNKGADKAAVTTEKPKKAHKASSVRVQGNPKTASQTVYLLPDGSGSPTSYATIGAVAPDNVALIAMGCPFMKDAEAFDCGIEGVAKLYVEEIQRRQPHGPYILGGWSAGGIAAYEACLQLQVAGEIVEKLIFLDVPCPYPPQALPGRLHHFFDSIGLLGAEGEAPDWLLPHFQATITALSSYRPRAMDPTKENIPKVYMIYARDGVCKNDEDPRPELTPDDPPHMNWLLFNRTDFGANGWDALLGGSEKVVPLEPIANVNHFTMLREPGVKEVPGRLRDALETSG